MYIKRMIEYGNRREYRKYHAPGYTSRGMKRGPREKVTTEKKAARNEKAAILKLKRLMINNFTEGDWHVTLTYPSETRPDPEGARKILRKAFGKLRAWFRKRGQVFKWIMVTEWASKNIHHHVTMNDAPGLGKALREIWPGGVHLTPLYENQNFEGLAEYFVKETKKTFRQKNNPYRQRYSCSRNLKKPEERREVIRADHWREDPKPSPKEKAAGFVLDKGSVESGFDNAGYPFLEYTLIRYEYGQGPRRKNDDAG